MTMFDAICRALNEVVLARLDQRVEFILHPSNRALLAAGAEPQEQKLRDWEIQKKRGDHG